MKFIWLATAIEKDEVNTAPSGFMELASGSLAHIIIDRRI
jgi:hypothetical protein